MFNDPIKVLEMIQPNDLVLDIGGASEVFPRANAVVDIIPYNERCPGKLRDMPEQFSPDTWYVGDICTEEPWIQFSDKQFDFVICSHVLEDIRDPIFVCKQMLRVAKAGYIEVPSKFRECCKHDAKAIITGWEHHRWLIEYVNDTLVFAPKLPYFSQFDYLGDQRRLIMYDYYYQFLSLHWRESFNYTERVTKGSPIEVENLFLFFNTFRKNFTGPFFTADHIPFSGKTLEWLNDFRLPIEDILSPEDIIKVFEQRCQRLNYRLTNLTQPNRVAIFERIMTNIFQWVKNHLRK
jgi:Methyltransferase domain